MNYATEEAINAVKDFTSIVANRHSLHMYLSEIPIGDEYGVLTPSDYLIGDLFEKWCKDNNIKVWE